MVFTTRIDIVNQEFYAWRKIGTCWKCVLLFHTGCVLHGAKMRSCIQENTGWKYTASTQWSTAVFGSQVLLASSWVPIRATDPTLDLCKENISTAKWPDPNWKERQMVKLNTSLHFGGQCDDDPSPLYPPFHLEKIPQGSVSNLRRDQSLSHGLRTRMRTWRSFKPQGLED